MVKILKLVFTFWNLRYRWKFRNKCVILRPLKFWGFPQSHFLVFTIKFHSPCMWAKTNYLIPLSRIWQKWWMSVPQSGYKDCLLSCLHSSSGKTSSHVVNFSPGMYTCEETEVYLQAAASKELQFLIQLPMKNRI